MPKTMHLTIANVAFLSSDILFLNLQSLPPNILILTSTLYIQNQKSHFSDNCPISTHSQQLPLQVHPLWQLTFFFLHPQDLPHLPFLHLHPGAFFTGLLALIINSWSFA